ncbi:uncharacterized protein [Nicotiana tomentosiformis]|uniref:uncharacterized protein n=1 Tax=Nicotiana tomentosiformis TaxID=4098 RepID=UPI00388CC8A8
MASQAQRSNIAPSPSSQPGDSTSSRVNRFLQLDSPVFTGTNPEEDPQDFIDEMHKTLRVMRAIETEVVELASYRLKEVAYSWFELWEESREEGSPPTRWGEFADAFIDHLLPFETNTDRAAEFETLRQGSLSVWDYHMRFAYLSKYAIYMLPIMEAREHRFLQGLSPLVINEAAIAALNSDMNYGKMVAFTQATKTCKLNNKMEREGSNKARSAGNMGGSSGGGKLTFGEGRQDHLSPLLSLRLVHCHQGPVSSKSGAVSGPVRAIGAPISRVIMVQSREDYGDHLRVVLDTLYQHKLYAKFSKCEFWLESVTFLGHVVSSEGIKADPQKIAAVKNWLRPTTTAEIRSFLGLAGYYKKKELNLRQRRRLELLKNYDIDILYHLRKDNIVADALSRKSMVSLAHLEAFQSPLAKKVHRLASLAIRLANSSEGVVIVQNRAESSLAVKVKEKQYNDPLLQVKIDA